MGQLRAYIDAPERVESDEGADSGARAERVMMAKLRPFARLKLGLLLRQARIRVRERENLRFERTRVFGVVRRIMIALGEHLERNRLIEDSRDVFFLTKEEIFSAVDGTSVTSSLRDLVELRRDEQSEHLRRDPADRFETFGLPMANPPSTRRRESVDGDETILRGTACCRGRITARVRIVRDPLDPGELAGRIMVAERTDPGWGPLFPLAVGLLVERGSLLSHSAIVAREMGIPAIVSIPGLLATLRDGEIVEMDGSTGEIRRLEPPTGAVVSAAIEEPIGEGAA
jgi:pyruvate,water dikinase